jgi:hypothetical protein
MEDLSFNDPNFHLDFIFIVKGAIELTLEQQISTNSESTTKIIDLGPNDSIDPGTLHQAKRQNKRIASIKSTKRDTIIIRVNDTLFNVFCHHSNAMQWSSKSIDDLLCFCIPGISSKS